MLIYGKDMMVGRWVAMRNVEYPDLDRVHFKAIGALDRTGNLIGGVIYSDYVGVDLRLTIAGYGNWLTLGNLRGFLSYPYDQLQCRRTTVTVARKNKKSRDLAERLGWKLEGVMRHAMSDGQDAFIYGLLKEECRWIHRVQPEPMRMVS